MALCSFHVHVHSEYSITDPISACQNLSGVYSIHIVFVMSVTDNEWTITRQSAATLATAVVSGTLYLNNVLHANKML